MVRVNPVGTEDHERDLLALDGTRYTRLMLAKCESADQVLSLAPREVIALVESPLGALAVSEIALAASTIGVMWGRRGSRGGDGRQLQSPRGRQLP